jgi:hypothetical protein
MGAADRTVQHLRLRAPTAQAAVHAVHRLEDALRCASLPDGGERVLLVRRLHLGRLPEGLSSQSLSLLIERRVAAVGGEWVHGDDGCAARSDTVFFATRLQAAQAALRRRARGAVLSAWYWPSALPGVDVLGSPPGFLAQLVAWLGAHPGAPALLTALAADACERGHTRWLLRQVNASLAQRWLVLAHAQGFLSPQALHKGAGTDVSSRDHSDGRLVWIGQEEKQEQKDERAQVQTAWLRALLLSGVQWGIASAAVRSFARGPDEGFSQVFAPHQAPFTAPRGDTVSPVSSALSPPGAQAAQPSFFVPSSTVDPGDTLLQHSAWDTDAATAAGGLLFMLTVLEWLGFPDWQARQPDQPLLALILRQSLLYLRVPWDDPAWEWLASLPATTSTAQQVWSEPACWREPGVRVLHDPSKLMTALTMARCWLIAVRRQLRHQAHMGLIDLCRRPAHLAWSSTHIDVVFAANAADLRVRRLGLDLDPGWVPWLGRVVRFVYGAHQGGRP